MGTTVAATILTGAQERDLEERDERVKTRILEALGENDVREQELVEDLQRVQEELMEVRKASANIRRSVLEEKWYELEDILDGDDVESLCNISPTRLLDD